MEESSTESWGCSTICGGEGGNGLSPHTQNQRWTLSRASSIQSQITHTLSKSCFDVSKKLSVTNQFLQNIHISTFKFQECL